MNTIKKVPKSSASISRKRFLEIRGEVDASPPLKLKRLGRKSIMLLSPLLFSALNDDFL